MAAEEKRGRGRPPAWHNKITAPKEALEFYAMLSKLQRSTAFDSCHVYHGARIDGVPMVKWQNKVHKLPFVIASYMGLPHGIQQCDTPGCCNPFHYIPTGGAGELLVHGNEKPGVASTADLEEWADLVDYELDKRAKRVEDTPIDIIRTWILEEDLSDEQLKSAIQHLKEKK